MANARTTFINDDYAIVAASVRPDAGGISNFRVPRSEDHVLTGGEGESYRIAWNTRDEPVSEDEFEAHAVSRVWGGEFRFQQDGKVP